jgi:hypothetical protein
LRNPYPAALFVDYCRNRHCLERCRSGRGSAPR